MDENSKSLIELLKKKLEEVCEDRTMLFNILSSLNSIFERFYGADKALVKQTKQLLQYAAVLQQCNNDNYPVYTRCNTRDMATDTKALIESAIEEVSALGIPQQKKKTLVKEQSQESGIKIINTLNQSQNQEQHQNQQQDLVVEILLEAVKDELKGKQLKDLLAIADEKKDPQEAHKNFLEKLKEYGVDVSASIVANILTNPTVWTTLGSLK